MRWSNKGKKRKCGTERKTQKRENNVKMEKERQRKKEKARVEDIFLNRSSRFKSSSKMMEEM